MPVAELRRRFGLDEPDAMAQLRRNGTSAWIGLPEREAAKIQDLWERDELGVELSVEVRAPVIVGVYPMRIARYVMENGANGHATNGNGHPNGADRIPEPDDESNGNDERRRRTWPRRQRADQPRLDHAPRPMSGAPSYGSTPRELPQD